MTVSRRTQVVTLFLVAAVLLASSTCGAAQDVEEAKTRRGTQLGDGDFPATPRLLLLSNNSFGAKCLDGSPPGYYFRPGRGNGSSSLHIHLPGGGWCTSPDDCLSRSATWLGSSTKYPVDPSKPDYAWQNRPSFDGVLSNNSSQNPSLADWSLARLLYCDGGGYLGTAGPVEVTTAAGAKRTLHMRGWDIIQAVLEDLQGARGLSSPTRVLLSGSSAGGQGVAAGLCDHVADAFPGAQTRCLVDSGYFIDAKDRFNKSRFGAIAANVTELHQIYSPKCMDDHDSSDRWKCFFPETSLRYSSTPVFIFSALFDFIALMIGNQVPYDPPYASRCLQEILRAPGNVTEVLRYKAWKKIKWKTNWCKPRERDAVFKYAVSLYWSVNTLTKDKRSFGAYMPCNTVHCSAISPRWLMEWVKGTSTYEAFTEWVSRKPKKQMFVNALR